MIRMHDAIQRKFKDEHGGISIAFVFFTLLAFAALGVVSYNAMKSDSAMAVKHVQAAKAQYMAESGAE